MRMMLLRNGMLMTDDPAMSEQFVAARFSIRLIDAQSLMGLINFALKSSFELGKKEL